MTLVRRDGSELEVPAAPEETVLEAAERADVALPFGCRTGACGTCAARLCAGTVSTRRPQRALKETHRGEGYVLTCVAVPETDCRLEVGAHIQAEMVSTPWR